MKIQILLVCEFGHLNGAERSLLATVDKLRSRVEYRAVVPPEGELIDEFTQRNIPVYSLQWKQPSGNNLPVEVIRRQFSELISTIKADSDTSFLVHANSLSSSRMAGPVCLRYGIKSIGHIRDIIRLGRQVIADLNCHQQLICVSEAVRQYHVNQGLTAEKAVVVYNGVNINQFYPAERPTKNSDLRPIQVGMAGQISLRKGWDVFLQAAQILESQGMACCYQAAGSRQSIKAETVELETGLKTAADQFAESRFRFLGQLPELSAWLRGLDIYVHTARQEPLGRVLLESAAAGLPIIASDVGGTREIFRGQTPICPLLGAENQEILDTGSALLIPPDNPQATAQAIAYLINNPQQRIIRAIKSRAIAVARFADSIAAENLWNLYQSFKN